VLEGTTYTRLSLIMSTIDQTSTLPFWKLLAFVCQRESSEILLCSVLIANVAIVLLLDECQLLIPSVEMLVLFSENTLCFIIYCINCANHKLHRIWLCLYYCYYYYYYYYYNCTYVVCCYSLFSMLFRLWFFIACSFPYVPVLSP
jgi:hypothetical protein